MTAESNRQLQHLSLAGRKHRDKGVPCEDASLSVSQNGVSVVCLSDGAGSSQYTHADVGAKCVVQTICELMLKHFDAFYYDIRESVVKNVLIAAIQSELTIKAKEMSLAGMEIMSCTMLFSAVKDTRMICGHIGDGIIARVSGSGMQPITLPQNGEVAASTLFVTLPDAQNYLRVIRTTTDDTHAVILMTDGVCDMVFDQTKLLLMPVVARLAELGGLPGPERERELTKTIRSFIIDASPISDDASIGLIYFSDTEAPDFDSLPLDKEICHRDLKDDLQNVQDEILPKVRFAREIYQKSNALVHEEIAGEEEAETGNETKAAPAHLPEDLPEIKERPALSGKKGILIGVGVSLAFMTVVMIVYLIFR